jgi:hypothetical protein
MKPSHTITPPEPTPEYCTCVTCEIAHRAIHLGRERARTLAEWVANGPEADRAARERVREIVGL